MTEESDAAHVASAKAVAARVRRVLLKELTLDAVLEAASVVAQIGATNALFSSVFARSYPPRVFNDANDTHRNTRTPLSRLFRVTDLDVATSRALGPALPTVEATVRLDMRVGAEPVIRVSMAALGAAFAVAVQRGGALQVEVSVEGGAADAAQLGLLLTGVAADVRNGVPELVARLALALAPESQHQAMVA